MTRDFRRSARCAGPGQTRRVAVALYENSLGLAFLTLFVSRSRYTPAVAWPSTTKSSRRTTNRPSRSTDYVASSRFWFESFQNWQSEFLSLAGMVIGTIYLSATLFGDRNRCLRHTRKLGNRSSWSARGSGSARGPSEARSGRARASGRGPCEQ